MSDDVVEPGFGQVMGTDYDGSPVREPRATAPIWEVQIRKWILEAAGEGQSAPRAGFQTVVVLKDQPWSEPDHALVASFGVGRYEWRVRTTRAIAGQVRMAKRGEFSPHVPEDLAASGQFNVTEREARAAGAMRPEADLEDDLEPAVPSPVRRMAREAPPAAPATADTIAEAIRRAMAPAASTPQDIAAIVKAALAADREGDLRATVAGMQKEIEHLKTDRAGAAELKALEAKFTALDHAFAAKSNVWDSYGPDIAALEKRKDPKPPTVEEELTRITSLASVLGFTKGTQAAPAPVGRTGIDLAADMGTKLLGTVDQALRNKGIIREDAIMTRGRGPAAAAEGASADPGDTSNGDGMAIDWRTFRKGAYAHLGPFLERLADDLAGDVRIPMVQLVSEAISRLHPFPAECKTLVEYDPAEVRDLVAYARGRNHPLVTSWTEADQEFLAAFQREFGAKLEALNAMKEKARQDAQAKKAAADENKGEPVSTPGNGGGAKKTG